MPLQEIIQAPFNYQDDLRVLPDRPGFIYGIYSSQTTTWQWWGYGQDLQENEINTVLITHGYRPMDKRTEDEPFQNRWDYRKKEPEWSTFREWLYTYYTHELKDAKETRKRWAGHRNQKQYTVWAEAMEDIYPGILEKMRTPTLEIMDLHTWIWDQYRIFDLYPFNHKKKLYENFGEITRDYIEWMEKIERQRQYPD